MTTKKRDAGNGVEGILGGLGNLLEKLTELADKGEELKRSGQFDVKTGGDRDMKGVFGFSVKVGLGDDQPRVEPFGNIRRDEETGESVVREVAEPMVDVFEEADHLQVVAEMPGIGKKDVQLDLKDDVLTIHAEHGGKKYHKEVLLPRTCEAEGMAYTCRNGILEIKLASPAGRAD